ncbi:MAG: GNAT family N-acetyltransferase [Deltaproteobacteria bacterium]|nr:GNAT family N-acetyltransferase [Deltaproteobacteria bacterium]
MKIELRPQRVSDAKRFFEILSNPSFTYFPAKPKSIEEEKNFLRLNREKRNNKTEFNFSIILNGEHVGAIGLRIEPSRPYLGEIGYFIDERYWGKGITTEALIQLEKFIQEELDLHRLEIRMAKENKASQRIAIKGGYKKEGIMREMLRVAGKWYDCYVYAKLI